MVSRWEVARLRSWKRAQGRQAGAGAARSAIDVGGRGLDHYRSTAIRVEPGLVSGWKTNSVPMRRQCRRPGKEREERESGGPRVRRESDHTRRVPAERRGISRSETPR